MIDHIFQAKVKFRKNKVFRTWLILPMYNLRHEYEIRKSAFGKKYVTGNTTVVIEEEMANFYSLYLCISY